MLPRNAVKAQASCRAGLIWSEGQVVPPGESEKQSQPGDSPNFPFFMRVKGIATVYSAESPIQPEYFFKIPQETKKAGTCIRPG